MAGKPPPPLYSMIVQADKESSETRYTFGPFHTEAALDEFLGRLEAAGYSNVWVHWLNAPALMGTGQETEVENPVVDWQ